MRIFFFMTLLALAGCAAGGLGGQRVEVTRVGPDDLLKLRAGPSLQFRIIAGVPDGTILIRHDCTYELGQKWCKVALADAPGLTGYVAADYLTDG